MDKGTWCLKELAVLEVNYTDSNNKQPRLDAYDVHCTQLPWFRNGTSQFSAHIEALNYTATPSLPVPLPIPLWVGGEKN